ncbi:MAG: sterol desaturase family protein [Pseudomonadota bacterium]|nr:sterol desaturase family protein [Pseudomonadota bacterium]
MRRRPQWETRKLQDTTPSKKLIWSEIRWSVITSFFFAIPGAIMIESWKLGGTKIYTDYAKYGWIYLFLSIFIYMFLHDTYFYWTHRLMHRPKIFRIFHQVHHESQNPTPWAAFSFHPYEAIIEALILPLLTFFVPIHIGALIFVLTAMTIFGVTNHTGYEIFSAKWMQGLWGKQMITATHHNQHHKNYFCNFGLYFRFWDKFMQTDKMT